MRKRVLAAFSWFACALLGVAALRAAPPETPEQGRGTAALGLTVRADGVLCKDGRPFRGIGVNYFDAFKRHLTKPHDTSYEAGFAGLAAEQIPYVRLAACGYWPNEQKLYQEDRQEFLRRLDDVVQAAEKHGVGLIPSLFWTTFTVPDLVGEPRSAWGNPDSKTRKYMRDFVRDVVGRYQASPAIWGWEFGNEYNLPANLPNAAQHRPPVVPHLGTAAQRSGEDDLTYEIVRAAFVAFGQEVRKYDPQRVISTGNSIVRSSAWHNWRAGNWTADDPQQFALMLRADNPNPIDLISVHLYDTPRETLLQAVRVAQQAKKPLFAGEFGVIASPDTREAFAALLQNIEAARVPLAALWVYDFSWQDSSHNITWTNNRAYQLHAVAAANERIRETLRNEPQ